MKRDLIPISFKQVKSARSYTCIVLGTEEKKFAIYTDPAGGKSLQTYLTSQEAKRPSTHDLLSMIFRGLEITVKQVVIHTLEDTIYSARLFLEQKNGDILHVVEIDARPSDCITLAVVHKAPLFCTKEVFDAVVPVVDE